MKLMKAKNITNRLKQKKTLILLGILICSLFLRLYKISDYMTFLGDEGRDALVWLRMVRNHKFTLIGPQTSIGNMYLGPLYYYLMLPFYFVLGTEGPSIGVALFGVGTTFLLWYCGKEWFSQMAGLLAALLYAISPVAIVYSRSSWNPNIMPFFSLLTVWGVWQFWERKKFFWLVLIGILLSFVIQSHYLGLLLVPYVGIFWFFKLIELKKNNPKNLKKFIYFSFFSILCFLILTILPLVWFDLRHNFLNLKAFWKFFSERQTTVNLKIYKAIPNLWPLWKMGITRLIVGKNEILGKWLAIIFIILLGEEILTKKKAIFKDKSLILILVWLGIGLGGMGLYKQHIYDHYFGFLFSAFFLLTGRILLILFDRRPPIRYLGIGLGGVILVLNLVENPFRYSPNYQMAKVQEIDKKIIKEAQDKPYNFALISKQNYEAGYEYFLELWGKPPLKIDPQKFFQTVADQLFVVCEDPICEPTTNPKAEIANFGWSKIEQEWEFPWGVKLFKLVHAKKG